MEPRFTVSRMAAAEVAGAVAYWLRKYFNDQRFISTVVAIPVFDSYDEEYLDIMVVYDGNPKKLDLSCQGAIQDKLHQKIEDLRIQVPFMLHFTWKKDWDTVHRGKHPRLSIYNGRSWH